LKDLAPNEWLSAQQIVDRKKNTFSAILSTSTPGKSVTGMLRTNAKKHQWFESKKIAGDRKVYWRMTAKGREHEFGDPPKVEGRQDDEGGGDTPPIQSHSQSPLLSPARLAEFGTPIDYPGGVPVGSQSYGMPSPGGLPLHTPGENHSSSLTPSPRPSGVGTHINLPHFSPYEGSPLNMNNPGTFDPVNNGGNLSYSSYSPSGSPSSSNPQNFNNLFGPPGTPVRENF
jgi:hypothetical protein